MPFTRHQKIPLIKAVRTMAEVLSVIEAQENSRVVSDTILELYERYRIAANICESYEIPLTHINSGLWSLSEAKRFVEDYFTFYKVTAGHLEGEEEPTYLGEYSTSDAAMNVVRHKIFEYKWVRVDQGLSYNLYRISVESPG